MKKKTNYITPDGHTKLVNELNHLLTVERPKMCKTIAWAAANGDRSENADYIYGKKRLREIDRRLRFLQGRVDDAVIVNPEMISSNKVQFGATVSVLDENEESFIYTIVGIDEVNIDRRFVSWRSPIGKSLLNQSVGDIVEVVIPRGILELEIIEIKYIKIESEE